MERLDLSIVPQEIEVQISDGTTVETYVLREASEDAAVRYRNTVMDSAEISAEGKPTRVRHLADIEPFLVHLCLWDSEGKNPTLRKVRSWPARVVKRLYDKAREISNLAEEEDTIEALQLRRDDIEQKLAKLRAGESTAKNSQSDTDAG